jgi:biotin transport system substrate-specific component
MTVYSCLFAALMVVGTYIKIPIGPVPIVLANFFVILAGALLGSTWGAASVGIFLFLGLIGLPVFSQGGGVAALVGPTGGYLFGYLIAAFVTGVVSEHGRSKPLLDIAALTAGSVVIYLVGLPWLKLTLHLSWTKALMVGVLPFLIGDAFKVAAAVAIVGVLRSSASGLFPVLEKRMSLDR